MKHATAQEHLINAAYKNLYHLEGIFKNDATDVTIFAKQLSLLEGIANEIKKLQPKVPCIVGWIDTTLLESVRDSIVVPIILLPVEER